jgi:hypothetical protein
MEYQLFSPSRGMVQGEFDTCMQRYREEETIFELSMYEPHVQAEPYLEGYSRLVSETLVPQEERQYDES